MSEAEDDEYEPEKNSHGEFQDLDPREYKRRIPNNRQRLQQQEAQAEERDVQECEFAEPDPVKRRQLANGLHVPVRMEACRDMSINIQYDDGQIRKFGQQKYFEEKLVPISKNGQFIYEAPESKADKKIPGARREDTRSMFDDPRLQKMRNNYTPKMLQRMTLGRDPREEEDDPRTDPGIMWKPVKCVQEIPQSFYMRDTFDRQRSGPRGIDKDSIKSEYDAFRLFFDDEIYQQIIKYTRERYQQRVEEAIYAYIHGFHNMGVKSRRPQFQQWEFTEYELEAYFAVQIFFGIVRLSNQRDYWKASCKGRQPKRQAEGRRKFRELAMERMDRYSHWVTQRMSSIVTYERFKTVRGCLNISGAEALKSKGRDPIWKIRDFLNQMNHRFQKYYYPGEFITIDEGMIPFAGKVQFKVYNPDKPTKWGIKEYLLCDATNTYTFQVRLYHGQTMWNNDFKQTVFVNEEDTQHRTMELVLQMCKDYEQRAHKVVMDNYYSSWQLFRELRNRGIGAVGTIRHNRTGLTKKDLTSKHFQQIYNQYHYAFYLNHSNELMLMYFQGTSEKEIALISNFLDNSLNEQHIWDIAKQHYYVPHPKAPYMMYIYNKYKGGVDRRNSYVVKYRSRFPAKKWWQSVFERLFETSILNAYLVFRSFNPETTFRNKGMMRDFRINLMYQFAERYKAYEHQLEENGKKGVSLFAKMQPHTFIEGEETVKCSECGADTRSFCSECTILKAEVIGLCDERVTVKCQRFHEFMDFELDKGKEFVDKRKGKPHYQPDYYEKLNQRTNAGKKETTPLIDLLKTIHEQVKNEAATKTEVKQEEQPAAEVVHDSDSDVMIEHVRNPALIQIQQKVEAMSELNSDQIGDISDNQSEIEGEQIKLQRKLVERFKQLFREEEDEGEDQGEGSIADNRESLEREARQSMSMQRSQGQSKAEGGHRNSEKFQATLRRIQQQKPPSLAQQFSQIHQPAQAACSDPGVGVGQPQQEPPRVKNGAQPQPQEYHNQEDFLDYDSGNEEDDYDAAVQALKKMQLNQIKEKSQRISPSNVSKKRQKYLAKLQ